MGNIHLLVLKPYFQYKGQKLPCLLGKNLSLREKNLFLGGDDSRGYLARPAEALPQPDHVETQSLALNLELSGVT